MDSNLYLQLLSVLQIYRLYIICDLHGKVSDPNRMMPIQQPCVDFLLSRLETTTRHVSFSDSFNFLKTELVAELIIGIVDLVQELKEFGSCIVIDDGIKLVNINENNRDLAFFVRKVLLSRSDFVSNQRWYQNVEDGL